MSNKRHKHYDVIVAAAEGKDVQRLRDGEWDSYSGEEAIYEFHWLEDQQYRIKPTLVDQWRFAVYRDNGDLFITEHHYKTKREVFEKFFNVDWAVPLEPTKIVVEE